MDGWMDDGWMDGCTTNDVCTGMMNDGCLSIDRYSGSDDG
jgi:hypothetical protein